MQLQKLVYFSHGWNLAVTGEPLVSDAVEAWDFGPVFPELYHHAKFFGAATIDRPLTTGDSSAARFFGGTDKGEIYSASLDVTQSTILAHVWSRYGNLSAFQMSNLTHAPGTPWYEAYTTTGRNTGISNDVIRQHFVDIGQQAAEPR